LEGEGDEQEFNGLVDFHLFYLYLKYYI